MHQFVAKGLSLVLVAFLVLGQSLPLFAGPQDGKVVAGSATIVKESATKTGITQTSNRATIDWKSFSIGANEQVQFYQPSASSVALNRVVGTDPSVILGRLTANGQVFLVNPNGIVFGKGSQVDVAGLMATTHNIKNDDFMAGRFLFNIPGNPGASVINEGTIRIADTGIAAFVAPGVANRGIIAAKLGKVALASANAFTLDFIGDELLSFVVRDEVAQRVFDLQGKPLTSFVENSGRIEAQGGYVLLSAKAAENVVQSVINQSGVIEATSVGQHNGEIVLSGGSKGAVVNTGTLDASGKNAGETGGRVIVTGAAVKLEGNALVDVSGDAGGGKALIGGDHMGGQGSEETLARYGLVMEKTAIANAQTVEVGSNVVINADALNQGKGGKVSVWGNDSTDFYGTASARGGKNGGDGGVVEISGGKRVASNGKVDVSAPKGKRGTYFIDPGGAGYSSPMDFYNYLYGPFEYMDEPNELSKSASQRGMFIQAMQVVGETTYVLTSRILNSVTRIGVHLEQNYPHEMFLTKIDPSGNISQVKLGGVQYFPIAGYLASHVGALYVTGGVVKVFCSSMDIDGSGMTGGHYVFNTSDLSAVGGVTALFSGSTTQGYLPYFWNDGASVRSVSYNDAFTDAKGLEFSRVHLALAGMESAEIDSILAPSRAWWNLYHRMSDRYKALYNKDTDDDHADDYGKTNPSDYVDKIDPNKDKQKDNDKDKPKPNDNPWAELTKEQLDYVNKYKNASFEDLFLALVAGKFRNNPDDPVWRALYYDGKYATQMQIQADRLKGIYDGFAHKTAGGLFEAIIAGNLQGDPNNIMWRALYIDGVATTKQIHAIQMINRYYAYKDASSDVLFQAILDNKLANDPNNVVWRALYDNGKATDKQILANAMWTRYEAYKAKSAIELAGLIESGRVIIDFSEPEWKALKGSANVIAALDIVTHDSSKVYANLEQAPPNKGGGAGSSGTNAYGGLSIDYKINNLASLSMNTSSQVLGLVSKIGMSILGQAQITKDGISNLIGTFKLPAGQATNLKTWLEGMESLSKSDPKICKEVADAITNKDYSTLRRILKAAKDDKKLLLRLNAYIKSLGAILNLVSFASDSYDLFVKLETGTWTGDDMTKYGLSVTTFSLNLAISSGVISSEGAVAGGAAAAGVVLLTQQAARFGTEVWLDESVDHARERYSVVVTEARQGVSNTIKNNLQRYLTMEHFDAAKEAKRFENDIQLKMDGINQAISDLNSFSVQAGYAIDYQGVSWRDTMTALTNELSALANLKQNAAANVLQEYQLAQSVAEKARTYIALSNGFSR